MKQRNTSVKWSAATLLLLFAAVLLSCSSPTEPERWLAVAQIISGVGEDPVMTVEATDNDEIRIQIVTYGNSCVEKGEIRVTVDASSRFVLAEVYDWLVRRGGICLDYQKSMHHSRVVGPLAAGEWLVRIRGGDGRGNFIEFDRSVEVGSRASSSPGG